MSALEKIPTFLIVGVLVIIFVCLKRHARSARLTLWTVGWTLVFTHFLAQLLEPDHGPANSFLLVVDSGSLQAAVVTFLVSVSSVAEDYAKRTILLLALGVPSVLYVVSSCYDVHATWPYVLCLVACFGGAVCFFFVGGGKMSLYVEAATFLCSLAGVWALRAALRGSFQEGTIALLATGFGLAAVFICRNHWRPSPAILTIAGGFFSWGAAFPIRLLMDRQTTHLIIPAELWHTPKLFVALGMILAVVEDKSESIAGMQHNAEGLNRQLERFSAITSRLLSGAELDTICPAIASAITDVTSFSVAVVQLEDAECRLRMAGSSGLSAESLRRLQAQTEHWTLDHIKSLCSNTQLMGRNSYLLPLHEAIPFALRENPTARWNGEELLIPLVLGWRRIPRLHTIGRAPRHEYDPCARIVPHRNARSRPCASRRTAGPCTRSWCGRKNWLPWGSCWRESRMSSTIL